MDVVTLGELLDRDAREHGENFAVIDGEKRVTYAELRNMANSLANGLIKLGIKKGDKIAIWMQNNLEWVISWFGIAKAGGVVVPMDTWYKSAEAEYIIDHSDSVAIILADRFEKYKFLDMLMEIRHKLGKLKHIIVVGENVAEGNGIVDFYKLMERGKDWESSEEFKKRCEENRVDDVTFILYTSGTTGRPKGVMLTHYNMVRNARDVARQLRATEGDKYLIPVPFSHCFGCVMGITAAANFGSTIVPVPKFDPELVLKTIEREKCTIVHGVPTMFIRELNVLENKKYDTTSLRTGIMAGAPCPVEVVKAVREKMHCNILIAYGLTEASPVITMTSFEDSDEIRAETVGRPLPDIEVRIVDNGRKPLPYGQVGELACRGYNVMKGYYKMPEETREAVDEEGWLYSGDLATMDEKKYVRIVGRKKEMIIVGGFNVYPREIEEYLHTHPMIQDVAVVGVPDEDLGEVVAAAIIPKERGKITEQDVVDYCYGKIASAKVPRYVVFVDSYPMTSRGKVQKFKLQEILANMIKEGRIKKVVPTAVMKRGGG